MSKENHLKMVKLMLNKRLDDINDGIVRSDHSSVRLGGISQERFDEAAGRINKVWWNVPENELDETQRRIDLYVVYCEADELIRSVNGVTKPGPIEGSRRKYIARAIKSKHGKKNGRFL